MKFLKHVQQIKSNFFDTKIKSKIYQINFRSHQQILNLGNSIVALLELVFPSRIDHLSKEKSRIIGPKPYLIESSPNNSKDLIFHLLNENSTVQKRMDGKSIFIRPNIEFGCNQVILVRSQESKKRIPTILAGALCLTVFEAKVNFFLIFLF